MHCYKTCTVRRHTRPGARAPRAPGGMMDLSKICFSNSTRLPHFLKLFVFIIFRPPIEHRSKINPNGIENRSKINPESIQHQSHTASLSDAVRDTLGSFDFGSEGPFWVILSLAPGLWHLVSAHHNTSTGRPCIHNNPTAIVSRSVVNCQQIRSPLSIIP